MTQVIVKVLVASAGMGMSAFPIGCASKPGFSSLHKTNFGQSAITVARAVRACTDVQQSGILDASQFSAATCVLDGHLIRFVTYATSDAQSNDPALDRLPGKVGHYAMGDGYSATVASPSTTVAEQERLAQAVINALGGSVVDYQNSP